MLDGGVGLVAVKLKGTVFELQTELLSGLKTVMSGGTVPGKGSTLLKINQGLAAVRLTCALLARTPIANATMAIGTKRGFLVI